MYLEALVIGVPLVVWTYLLMWFGLIGIVTSTYRISDPHPWIAMILLVVTWGVSISELSKSAAKVRGQKTSGS
jgi:hypothetical protein